MGKYKTYEKYKDSGIPWLGGIPGHWEVRKIKYLFTEQDGRSLTGSEDLLSVSQYTGVTRKMDKVINGDNLTNAKTLEGYKLVAKDDLVINIMLAWNGSLGISRFDGIVSPAYCVYKLKIGNAKYFGYLFKTKNAQQEFKKNSTGIIDSRLRLYTENFYSIKTAVPPKEEQTAIARFLDYKLAKINRFIRKKKQLIQLLNEQKAAISNQAVTKGLNENVRMKDSGIEWLGEIPEHWEVRKLKYVAEIYPSNVDKHSKEGEKAVRLCNYTDVYKNDYITNDMNLMVATASDEQIERFTLLPNDVMITKDSETADDIAVPAVVKENLDNVVCGYHLSVMRPNDNILGEFLFRVLQSKVINIQFEVKANGVTRVGLGTYSQKNPKIPLPPISEQIEIIDFILKETQTVTTTISKIEKEIALVEEYTTALVAEAVTGKIDVRDYKMTETGMVETGYEEEEETLSMVAEDTPDYQTEETE